MEGVGGAEAHTTGSTSQIKQPQSAARCSKNKVRKLCTKVKNCHIFGSKIQDKDESLLVAASVLAAMAYQAAISPPGGVFAMDAKDYNAAAPPPSNTADPGESIISRSRDSANDIFWIFNTISFMASLSVIFMYVSGASMTRRNAIWCLRGTMWLAVTSMALAYIFALDFITRNSSGDIGEIIVFAALAWLGIMTVAVVIVVCRLIIYLIRRICHWVMKLVRPTKKSTKKRDESKKDEEEGGCGCL